VLTHDQFEHRLVAKPSASTLLPQLRHEIIVERNRGGLGPAPQDTPDSGCANVAPEITPLELGNLRIARRRTAPAPTPRCRLLLHRLAFQFAASGDS